MKRFRIAFVIVSLLLLCGMAANLTGCAAKIHAADLMKDMNAEPVSGKAADERFISSQMKLSVELFKASAEESKNKNVLVSPLSIELALAMTANGADGQTRAEMETLLGGGILLEELNEYLYSYVNSLPTGEKYKLSIANSIWFRDDDGLNVKQEFLQTNANYYGAQAYKAPFDAGTVKAINNWVDEHTDGMIDKIIEEISRDTVMYLINAFVFDAEWEKTYEESDVHPGSFTSVSGDERDAEMMSSTENKYLNDGRATGFIKNYKDGKYSFAALLPNEGADIYEYISGLTDESLQNILENVRSESVLTKMPKFSSEYEHTLNGVLAGLGMPSAFDGRADFSRITEENDLCISEVLHKTYISVDEAGTKAGAATSVALRYKSAPICENTVTLDRPFVYMIIDNSTNLPIFIGAVVDITE